jgi:Mce-associated membrane protein
MADTPARSARSLTDPHDAPTLADQAADAGQQTEAGAGQTARGNGRSEEVTAVDETPGHHHGAAEASHTTSGTAAETDHIDVNESNDHAEVAELGGTEGRDDEGRKSRRPGAKGPPRRRRPTVFVVAVTTLTLLAVTLATVGVILTLQYRAAEADEARRQAVLQAARQQIINLVSISAETADHDIKRLLEGATGQFADELETRSQAFAEVVKQAQVKSNGEISEVGIVRVDDNSARVLVAAKAIVRNTAAPEGEERNYRFAVNLEHQGDRWLVSTVEFVP